MTTEWMGRTEVAKERLAEVGAVRTGAGGEVVAEVVEAGVGEEGTRVSYVLFFFKRKIFNHLQNSKTIFLLLSLLLFLLNLIYVSTEACPRCGLLSVTGAVGIKIQENSW